MTENAEQPNRTVEEMVDKFCSSWNLRIGPKPQLVLLVKSYASQECEKQREALEQSVKLQSHYAVLLNGYDGGKRKQFKTAQEWIDRLRFIATAISTSEKGEG